MIHQEQSLNNLRTVGVSAEAFASDAIQLQRWDGLDSNQLKVVVRTQSVAGESFLRVFHRALKSTAYVELAWLLAADLTIAITQSSTTREQMLQRLQTVLVAATGRPASNEMLERWYKRPTSKGF
jgi:hypothetical protein